MKLSKLSTALCITLALTASYSAHALTGQEVYSVSEAALYGSDIKASTIVKGVVNNKTVYKAATQTVSKALFVKTSKKVLGLNPWGIALLVALEAYDYYADEDGNIFEYQTAEPTTSTIGRCGSSVSGPIISLDACAASAIANQTGYTWTYYALSGGNNYKYYRNGGYIWFYFYPDGTYETTCPSGYTLEGSICTADTALEVSDDAYWDAVVDYMNQTPDFSWADAMKTANGDVIQDYFPDPEFELVTATDTALMDQYASGLLQSTYPAADYYVTPEEYERIKDLYDTANMTDEQTAEALNEALEQAITQEQYQTEQTAIEAREEARKSAAAASLAGLDISTNEYIDSATTINQDFIDSLSLTNDLPDSGGFLGYFDFNSSTGCETIELPFNVIFPTTSQCEKLGTLKTLLGYFLFCLIAWNMINTVLKEAN